MCVCFLLFVLFVSIAACSADVKIESKPADRFDSLTYGRTDSAWKHLAGNPNVQDADSVRVGECIVYRGYFHGSSYGHIQCPSWARAEVLP